MLVNNRPASRIIAEALGVWGSRQMKRSLLQCAIVFDVDQTLADTSLLDGLRRTRQWDACIRKAAGLALFNGIDDAIRELHGRGATVFVASSAAQRYVNAFAARLSAPIEDVLHFYSVSFRARAGLSRRACLKADQLQHVASRKNWDTLVFVGDDRDDAAGASLAGAHFVHACWGGACEAINGIHPGLPTELLLSVEGIRSEVG